ncbi:hypothetical protein PFISCL1PPCAC_352, partial [Pristionchus fissidentatus]
SQNIPFLELLSSDSVAAQLSQHTAQQAARNEKEIMMRNEAPQVKPIDLNAKPSEIFGQAFTNLARPLKMQTFDTVEHPERLLQPQPRGDQQPAAAAAASSGNADASLHAALFAPAPARNATATRENADELTRIDDLEQEIRVLREKIEERKKKAEKSKEKKKKQKGTKKDKKDPKKKHAKDDDVTPYGISAAAAKTVVPPPMESCVSVKGLLRAESNNANTDNFMTFHSDDVICSAVMPKQQPPPEERVREIEIRRARMNGDAIFPTIGNTPIQPVVQPAAAAATATAPVRATADVGPLMQLASAFLKGSGGAPRTEGVSSARLEGLPTRQQPQLPSIKEVVPGANQNFGIPRGQGCLPFLGEFMQIAYGNCVKEADEAAYSSWSAELQSAVLSGKMDLLKASRESCKRGAEREQCNQLRQAISNCDIMDSLQITASLQRNLKRCEEISGIVDQNPMTVISQIGNLVNGEFTHGFLNNFLG